MRPVTPGPWPLELSGSQVRYTKSGHARPNLSARLGPYCSYCEMRINVGLAVEHIVSKSYDAARERDWTNFLLACTNCNSNKGDQIESEADTQAYLWPHRDRTFDAFDYRAGAVRIAPCPDRAMREKAEASAELVKLLRTPEDQSKKQLQSGSDNRWRHRLEAYRNAANQRRRLARTRDPQTRADFIETICESAAGLGFWSVWMTVFADQRDVQEALSAIFPGTAVNERVYPLPPHLGPTRVALDASDDGHSKS